jgi:glycosyltransferase involved in cell wall biosynthesis
MLTLAAELRMRYHISFGCMPNEPGVTLLERAHALGVDTLPLDGRGTRFDPEILRLQRWLRDRRVDVFHLHAGVGWEGHTVTYAAREAGVPVVVRTEHLPDVITDPVDRTSHSRLVEALDGLICVSRGVYRSFVLASLPGEKVCTIRNGIAPHRPHAPRRSDVRQGLGLPQDAPIVLTVARFVEQKGYQHLLKAIPSILSQSPCTYFLWVGQGPLKLQLQRQVRAQGLAERVRFLGQRGDARSLMGAADLLVMPSLFEGLPLVVLEAMAAGLPVIGTRVCGTCEAVVHGRTGLLVDVGDVSGLAAAIVEGVTRPDLAAQWGAAGRQRLEQEFSSARMARETTDLYENLLQRAKVIAPARETQGEVSDSGSHR